MTTKRENQLLRDLFAFFAEYGEEEIQSALKKLRAGDQSIGHPDTISKSQELVSQQTQKTKDQYASKKKSKSISPRLKTENFFNRLLDDSDDSMRMVGELVSDLVSRRIAPTSGTLKQLALEVDLQVPARKVDRVVLSRRIGERLIGLAKEKRISQINRIRDLFRDSETSTLQGWSNLIVKDNQNR